MMNANDHPLWSSQPGIGDTTVDFANFLNYDLPISYETPSSQNNDFDPSQLHHDPNAMDTNFSGSLGISVSAADEGTRGMRGDDGLDGRMGMMDMRLHQALQQQYDQAQAQAQAQARAEVQVQILQRQLRMNNTIPPTPSSLELQCGDLTPQMFYNPYGMKDDQVCPSVLTARRSQKTLVP